MEELQRQLQLRRQLQPNVLTTITMVFATLRIATTIIPGHRLISTVMVSVKTLIAMMRIQWSILARRWIRRLKVVKTGIVTDRTITMSKDWDPAAGWPNSVVALPVKIGIAVHARSSRIRRRFLPTYLEMALISRLKPAVYSSTLTTMA